MEPDRATLFSNAVSRIYDAITADPQREAVKKAVCALLDADGVVFTTAMQTAAAVLSDAGESPNHEQSLSDRRPPRSDGHILSLDIIDRGYDKLGLLVLRNSDRIAFTESDLEWLAKLRPHLEKAEFVRGLMPDGEFGSAASVHLARSMSEGLVVTTTEGDIEWLNPAARDILGESQGLMNFNGRLRAARAFETARIEALTREAGLGHSGVMLVSQASTSLPFGLVFASLAYDLGLARQRRHVLVTIKDMQRHTNVIASRLADVFGLTKAEQQIGALLLMGYSLQASAELTGKSLTTVKKQLRSMLTKTGAHNQTELVRMFLSVPSLL